MNKIVCNYVAYLLEDVNRTSQYKQCYMKEIQLVILGLIALIFSVLFFYFTDMVPKNIENREMNIVISLSVGLLILVVDKRQDRHINEIIHTQHKMTHEIHKMIQEQMSIIKEMHKGSSDHNKKEGVI